MADKSRSVNTKFWEDPFIETLNITEKLLFLYLLTNTQTNILGIYEISIKRISYDTGIDKQTIQKALKGFETVQKAYFIDNFIILPNFLKNQKLNANMKVGAAKIFNALPEHLKVNILGNDLEGLSNDSKGFEMVRNGLLKYEIEIESKKDESEKESKKDESKEILIPEFSEFLSFALEKEPLISEHHLKLKYEAWKFNGWKNGNDKAIKNWKSSLLNTIPHIEKNKQYGSNQKNNKPAGNGFKKDWKIHKAAN